MQALVLGKLTLKKGRIDPVPLYGSPVPAGFPSPASDYIECNLDLNQYLIEHPAATYFVRAVGDSMKDSGIFEGDILIVDRSLPAANNNVVVASIDNELTVKRFRKDQKRIYLVPSNPVYPVFEIKEGMDVCIWGVVTYVIHKP